MDNPFFIRTTPGIPYGIRHWNYGIYLIRSVSPDGASLWQRAYRHFRGSLWEVYHGFGSIDVLNYREGFMANKKQNHAKRDMVSSFYKAFKSFGKSFPMLLGVILVLGLFRTFVSKQMLSTLFTGELLRDTVVGSLMGSISAGNPITSYIIGGELVKENVSLVAITSFIVAWVTVGIIQLPAEAAVLGGRFACTRNMLGLIFSILISIATISTLVVI